MKNTLKEIIEQDSTKLGKQFNITIQILVILSLISFSIETLPQLNESTHLFIKYSEIFIVIIFTLEYFLRIYVSDKKISYIFSFYGIIDLLAILPFYLSTSIDLRAIKLFRLLKLLQYSKSIRNFSIAFKETKTEFTLFFFLTLILFYLASVGIYFFENQAQPEVFKSIFHSMWWAVATLTTVGYGDAYPITVGGKIFTTFILIIGLGVVSLPAGIIASTLLKTNDKKGLNSYKEIEKLKIENQLLKKQIKDIKEKNKLN